MSNTKTKRIPWKTLTVNERSMILFIAKSKQAHLEEMQAAVFGTDDKGTSPSRNTIRRLRESGYIQRVDPGTYAITPVGKRVVPKALMQEVRKPAASPPAAPKAPPVEAARIQLPIEFSEAQPVTMAGDVDIILSADERRAVELLRLALGLVTRENIYERRGDERRTTERRGVDRRALAQNGHYPDIGHRPE